MTPHEDWKARAKSVRIEDEVARRGVHLRGQKERAGPCPQCGGTDRFSINTAKQVFNCRGCGRGGDVIAMVQHLDGVSFKQAIATLVGGGVTAKTTPRPTPAKPAKRDDDKSNAQTAAWLWSQRRKITEGTPPALYLRKRGYISGLSRRHWAICRRAIRIRRQ
jgi:putative DNA primase/helicase